MDFPAGRLAVVTGGAGDVGSAIAGELSRLGATVVVADLDLDAARAVADGLGGPAVPAYLDLADDDGVRRFVEEVRPLGPTGVLVSNAGVARVERFVDSDPAGWDHLYRVNQRGPMLLTQLLLPAMAEEGHGRLVFVSSDGARAGAAGEAVYAATKASLFGFAKCVAREHARHGITANVVCPGPVNGRMVAAAMADHPEQLERLERAIPLRRLAEPVDVASTVAWLSGPGAAYVTGQVISVSGGITMH